MHVRSCMRGSTDRCFLRSQPGQGDEVQRRANNTQRAARTNPCKWEEREQLWQEGSGGWRKSVGVSVGRNLQRHRSGPPPGIHTGLKKGLNEKGSKNKCEIVWVLWLEGSLCHKSQFTKKTKKQELQPRERCGVPLLPSPSSQAALGIHRNRPHTYSVKGRIPQPRCTWQQMRAPFFKALPVQWLTSHKDLLASRHKKNGCYWIQGTN